ncbi:MAG TPA: copper homeostasis protein CutC [Nocardioides sp.]|nr:copper homeostasis protein CutC [Nocardioides sp.]
MSTGTTLLEVTVLGPRDVAGADEGGADRLHLVAPDSSGEPGTMALSPEPGVVSSVCRETDLPVFVLLRLNDSWTTTGGELVRLVGLAEDYLGCGATGVSFGFLDSDLEVDTEVWAHLAGSLPGVPWTFHRAFDDVLEARRSWRRLIGMPGLTAVCSAGSPRGLSAGYDDLLAACESDPAIATLAMPGGGLLAEHVPWFVRAGVRQFHLGSQARPGASYKSYVDAGHVRSWRLLVDSASRRALGA